jgi:hypothetical protein
VTFFLLTLCFYWILETNKRRNLQLTLLVCPALLGFGSEVVQGLLPVSVIDFACLDAPREDVGVLTICC